MIESNIFKKIIDKEIKTDFLYEDKKVLAFRDISPQAPEHILIIPIKEISTINDIVTEDKELIGHMFLVAIKIAQKLKIEKNGYRIVFNCNEDGGQSVYHLHMHLIGGRKLLWPPG